MFGIEKLEKLESTLQENKKEANRPQARVGGKNSNRVLGGDGLQERRRTPRQGTYKSLATQQGTTRFSDRRRYEEEHWGDWKGT